MEKPREITVKGIGKYTVSPDFIKISFELEKTNKDYKKGYEQFQKDIEELHKLVTENGFEKKQLKAGTICSSEKYEYSSGNKKTFIGYLFSCTFVLEFDYDMEKLTKITNAVGKTEIKPEIRIIFTVKDEDDVKEKLLESAAQMAKRKAEILCKAMNAKLGMIKNINYNWEDIDIISQTQYKTVEPFIWRNSERFERNPSEIEFAGLAFTPKDIELTDDAVFVWEIE